MTADRLLTSRAVAEQLGVNVKQVYALVHRGVLVAVQIGGARRYRQADVDAAIATLRQVPGHEQARPVVPTPLRKWNETAHRPYGMTMLEWKALGLTRMQWETGSDQKRQRRRRNAS